MNNQHTIRRGITLLLTMVMEVQWGVYKLFRQEWIDAFYLTIIIISTVGFRKVHSLSEAVKIL